MAGIDQLAGLNRVRMAIRAMGIFLVIMYSLRDGHSAMTQPFDGGCSVSVIIEVCCIEMARYFGHLLGGTYVSVMQVYCKIFYKKCYDTLGQTGASLGLIGNSLKT